MIAKLLLLHYVADFLLQPREMGERKSSDVRWLAGHLVIQFFVFFPFTSLWFALANCAVHGVIDWFIWRGYKWTVRSRIYYDEKSRPMHSLISDHGAWRYWLDKVFYDTIGLDQLLHGLTLIYLSNWLL